ncbi:PTS sugar transporter subunit IIA, partial [Vagococcus salmoninarum]
NLSKREAVHLLETKQSAIETVISLIDSFEVIPITETKLTPNSIIRAMCTNLLSHQPALDIEALVKALTIREEWSGFGITNTKIALFHARTAEIKTPVFQLFPLKDEVQIPGMDGSQVMVNTLVLLLAPEKLDSRGLEVMSQISSLLIEDPETIALIQSGKISEISDFVIQRLVSFIDN